VDPILPLACVPNDDTRVFWGASFSLVSAIITALLAPSRGRSAFWWFFIGGFFPWVSILVLYLLRDLSLASEPMPHPPGGPAPGGIEPPWPSVTEPALALPQDGWFYASRRHAMGPVSLQFLRSAIRTGTLGKNIPVWCSAFREWVTPNRVPGFFG
jgi:hypothetical protein